MSATSHVFDFSCPRLLVSSTFHDSKCLRNFSWFLGKIACTRFTDCSRSFGTTRIKTPERFHNQIDSSWCFVAEQVFFSSFPLMIFFLTYWFNVFIVGFVTILLLLSFLKCYDEWLLCTHTHNINIILFPARPVLFVWLVFYIASI